MADVSRVSGPGGPQDPSKKDKSVADAQKFRELMKVQKVDEVDEEQKKKRKRPQEAEEEAKAIEAAQGAQPPVGVPPTDAPPFAPPGKKVGGVLKSGELGGPPAAAAPTPAPTQPEEGSWEGEAYMQTFPDTTPTEKAAQPPLKSPPPSTPLSAPEPIEPTRVEQPQEPAKRAKVQPPAPLIGPPPAKRAAQKQEAIPPKAAHKEEKESYFTQAKKAGKKKEEIPSVPEDMEGTPVTPPPAAGETRATKKAKGEEKIEEIAPQTGQMQTPEMPFEAPGAVSAPTPPAPYTYLHPQVLDMFERMVGVMTVMTNAGISETTITLSSPQYTSSLFYGAQIIIQEYSTAPKAFNVQLIASPQAVKLFNANADDLMAAFQTGKYNFRINRLEASLATDRPLFKRKEGVSGEGKGKEKGER